MDLRARTPHCRDARGFRHPRMGDVRQARTSLLGAASKGPQPVIFLRHPNIHQLSFSGSLFIPFSPSCITKLLASCLVSFTTPSPSPSLSLSPAVVDHLSLYTHTYTLLYIFLFCLSVSIILCRFSFQRIFSRAVFYSLVHISSLSLYRFLS